MAKNLISPLATLARIVSRDFGLTVRFQGDGAWVNLKTKEMCLPSVADPRILDVMDGYLDHEAGHVRFTDPGFKMPKNKYHEELFRVMEDVRVDNGMGNVFLGSKVNIWALREKIYAKLIAENEGHDDKFFWMDILENLAGRLSFDKMCPMAQFAVFAALDLFMKFPEADTSGKVKKLAGEIIKRWDTIEPPPPEYSGDGDGDESGEAGDQEGSAEGSGEGSGDGGRDSTSHPWDKDKDKKKEKKKSKKGSKGSEDSDEDGDGNGADGDEGEDEGSDKGDDGSGASGEDDGDGDADSKDGDDADGNSKDGADGDDSEDGGSGADAGDGDSGSGDGADGDADGDGEGGETILQGIANNEGEGALHSDEAVRSGIDLLVKEVVKDVARKGVHIPFTTEFDEIAYPGERDKTTGFGDKGPTYDWNEHEERKIRERARQGVGPLIRRLELALLARDRARFQYELDRGKIDTRRLHALASRTSNRVFKRRIEAEVKSTALELLVDCSGSMHARISPAREAACAFSDCLERIGIPHEVAGFWTAITPESARAWRDWSIRNGQILRNSPFNRGRERLVHLIVKRFDQSFKEAKFSALQARANNTDGESVRIAAWQLARRPEKRKVLMVFSDGNPVAEGSHRMLYKDLKDAVSEINAAGIHTIGIGIQTNAPRKFYPDNLVLDDVTALPTETMIQLEKILLKGKGMQKRGRVA